MRALLLLPALSVLFTSISANVWAQDRGLHNSSKDFTSPDDIEIADMSDPSEIARSWEAAIIYVPDGPGRAKKTSIARLTDRFGDGSVQFPTAIHMHGCSGIWPGTHRRLKFLAENGFLAIGPASMARKKYAQSCNPRTHEGGMFRPVLAMRQLDAGYAIETAKSLPFVDADNMLLIGLSEGGITTATFKPENEAQKVRARVIEGWTCTAGWYEYIGINAPADEPVLAIVGEKDPWFQDQWTRGHCGTQMNRENGSKSVVYDDGKLADKHELLEFRAPRDEVLSFLKTHMDLPLNVREVQQALVSLGHNPGPVDGVWGRKTLAALNALRAKHDLAKVKALEASSQMLLKRLLAQ